MNNFRSIFILFLLLTGISFSVFSQIDTVFLNKSGKKCFRIDASSYRIFTPDSVGFIMHQYRMNDSLKMTGHYRSLAPNEVRDGQFVEYFESGDVLEESIFDKQVCHRPCYEYHTHTPKTKTEIIENHYKNNGWNDYGSNTLCGRRSKSNQSIRNTG